MNRRDLWTAALVLAATLTTPPPVAGQENVGTIRRTTYLTFNQTVRLPGIVLPPGTYVFELLEPSAAASLVRVSNAARSKVYLTAFTRVVARPRGLSPQPTLTLGDAANTEPKPVRTWWPVGESTGREFIYGPGGEM